MIKINPKNCIKCSHSTKMETGIVRCHAKNPKTILIKGKGWWCKNDE